ncbi:O-fucosyltransferase family protein [Mucilaginibacter segetis]|uniref:Uncharacterized protein n=1 Tax=Mucilaginibacter segetis TaxID=2793071 RepID=A0A934PNE0_9SPHI|nr:hypothetical protein [Mucilaginibacter segetis]MBK0377763.1 hypothetical protein [Mucilaginibacter segetis]
MKLETARNANVQFFLTTDDASVEHTLKEIFKERIISHPKELSRQTVLGMQDAVSDIFTLSNTNKILGSYWSSFSEVASFIRGAELEVIKILN